MSNTSERPPCLTLQIKGFPTEPLDCIEKKAAEASPRTNRNALIEWILTEFAAGRLVHVDTLKGKEIAA